MWTCGVIIAPHIVEPNTRPPTTLYQQSSHPNEEITEKSVSIIKDFGGFGVPIYDIDSEMQQ